MLRPVHQIGWLLNPQGWTQYRMIKASKSASPFEVCLSPPGQAVQSALANVQVVLLSKLQLWPNKFGVGLGLKARTVSFLDEKVKPGVCWRLPVYPFLIWGTLIAKLSFAFACIYSPGWSQAGELAITTPALCPKTFYTALTLRFSALEI